MPGKEKVVAELQSAAAKSDTIYLATDEDREGEAIAWHLQEVLGGAPERFAPIEARVGCGLNLGPVSDRRS